jgi:iron complex transport system ATP-binding protein
MFHAFDVSFARGKRRIISDCNLELRAGELTVVIGPNGAGKSTLLKLLTGDLVPSKGNIRFDGRVLQQWNARDLAARRAVLSQSTSLVFPFTVHEVISLGFPDGSTSKERHASIRDALTTFDLKGFEHRLFQELSGGEQQRVHLARVVCQLKSNNTNRQKFLFLDEPVSNLDIKHQINTLTAVRELLSPQMGVFVILHDLNLAASFADRIVIIHDGRIVANDTTSHALKSETLKRVFDVDLNVVRHGTGRRIVLNTPMIGVRQTPDGYNTSHSVN